MIGPDLQVLDRLARQVEKVIEGTPGTRDVKNPLRVARTNLRLDVDTQKAALLGVPSVEFDRAVRLSVSGLEAGKFKDASGEQYPIVVRTPVNERADLETLGLVRVPTVGGSSLPLSQLATLQFESAPVQISRFDRERSVTINSEVQRGENTARVTAAVVHTGSIVTRFP